MLFYFQEQVCHGIAGRWINDLPIGQDIARQAGGGVDGETCPTRACHGPVSGDPGSIFCPVGIAWR